MLFSKSRCITALFLLMLPAAVQAQFNYITNGDSITITGYTGPGGAVVIPASTNGYPVTTIGDFAFIFSGLSSVTIPDSVTLIGELAFYNCTNLSFVDIPDSVTGMGIGAFGNCASLTSASFDGNTPLSDNTTFQGDPVTVYYQPGTTNWLATFGGALTLEETAPTEFAYYTNNGSILIQRYSGSDSKVVIPPAINGYPVTVIGEFSFDVTSLSSVIIPPTVNSIGLIAFFGCTNLSAVTIPASVTNIAGEAFANCTNLTSAWFQGNAPPDNGMVFSGDPATVYYLPGTTNWSATFGTVPTMEETASTQFDYVTNDDSITITGYIGSDSAVVIPDLVNGYAVVSVGLNAFTDNLSLTGVTIPNSVTNIDGETFAGCTNLTSVVLPDSIITIGDDSFGGCFSLTSVTIPNSVMSIGVATFDSCISLTSITIPNSVTNVGGGAFEYCISMTNILVNANNPDYSSLNGVLFDKAQDTLIECPAGLTNSAYTIPNSVETVEGDAFSACANLGSVTIPGSVTNILGAAFFDCTGLTNICVNATNPAYSTLNGVLFDKAQDTLVQYPPALTNTTYSIPNSVTTIQSYAFASCNNLAGITIPNCVASFGFGVFQDCTNLASVVVPNGVTNIPAYTFYYCSGLTSIVITDSVTSIGWQAFLGCSSLTNFIIPAGITNIEDMAFFSCSSLTSAYFQGNAPAGGAGAFNEDPTTVYYLPGTTGWGTTYGNVPTQLWFQPQPLVLTFEPSFGVQNNQFGFTISWATNTTVVVQVCTNLSSPVWIPVATNALSSGTNFFSDPSWANYPNRYYRIIAP